MRCGPPAAPLFLRGHHQDLEPVMSKCQACSQDEYVAERLAIWNTANAALRSQKWHGDDEEEPAGPHPDDVWALAQFLAGDTVS